MDVIGVITMPCWLVTVLLIATIFTLYSVYCLTYFWKLGIPGPTPTLYLGNLRTFLKKGTIWTDVEFARKYGKIFGVYFGHVPALMVTDLDIMKEICIGEFSKFPNRIPPGADNDPMMKGAVSLTRDDYWKFMRTTISPSFSTGKMRQMEPLFQNCAADFVNKLKEDTANGNSVNVCTYCDSLSMEVIASTSFGMEIEAQRNPDSAFIKNAKKAFAVSFSNPILVLYVFFPFIRWMLPYLTISSFPKDVSNFFTTALNSVIEDRKTEKTVRKDMLWLMINAHKDTEKTEETEKYKSGFNKRPLTNQEILANGLIFLSAGYETTANTIYFCMYCMAVYPDCAEKLQDEVDRIIKKEKPTYDNVAKLQYLDMFVCEVLRLYAPLPRFNRIAEEDVEIKGYKIPKGTDVHFPVCAIHRDPKIWPDPEIFNPERFTQENKAKRSPYAWVPFGVGPRNCLGMRFALTEIKMAMVAVVQNFTVHRCPETEVPLTFNKGLFIGAANGVQLKLEQR